MHIFARIVISTAIVAATVYAAIEFAKERALSKEIKLVDNSIFDLVKEMDTLVPIIKPEQNLEFVKLKEEWDEIFKKGLGGAELCERLSSIWAALKRLHATVERKES